MRLAVDMDDVVVEFVTSVASCFAKEYGIVVPPFEGGSWGQDVVEFSTHPLFKEAGYDDWWGWLRDRDWLWGSVFPAVDGAIGGIKRLREAGHYIEIVTSKPLWAEPQVWRWLGKWRPAVNQVTIVTFGQSKLGFTDADVIIDDKRSTCQEFADAGRYAIHFARYDAPPSDGRLLVAKDWIGVVKQVEELT